MARDDDHDHHPRSEGPNHSGRLPPFQLARVDTGANWGLIIDQVGLQSVMAVAWACFLSWS
jgi:hypothetical protein